MKKAKKKFANKTWLYILLGVAALLLIVWFVHMGVRHTVVVQHTESVCTVVDANTIRCDCNIQNGNNEPETYSNLLTSTNGCDNSMCNDLCGSYADFLKE